MKLRLRRGAPFTFRADAQRPHPPIRVAAIDAHQLRCARDVATGFIDFALDELAMIGVAGFLEGWETIGRCGRLSVAKRGQIFHVYSMVLVHDDDALDSVSQLAYIAGPRMSLHRLDSFFVKPLRFLPISFGKTLIEM